MLWRGIGVLAAMGVLGAVAGHVASAGDAPSSPAARVGAATLTLDSAWRRVDATTFSNGLQSMRVTFARAAGPSLVPAGVHATGAPKSTLLAGYRAWSYGAVTILPTTRGTLAVECDCANAVRSVSIAGAAILEPTPDLALRLRAPGVLAALDATRVKERRAWTDTSAQRLAAAHRTALDTLRPLARPPLTRALSDAALAYDSLAQTTATIGEGVAQASAAGAAGDGDAPSAYAAGAAGDGDAASTSAAGGAGDGGPAPTPAVALDAARADVAAADHALDGAVAALARDGAPAVQPSIAATASGGGTSLPVVLLVLVVALTVAALGPVGLRRLRRRRPAVEPSEAADYAAPDARGPAEDETSTGRACRLTAHRRKPIAPPPTFGRWNEPPRGPGAAPEDDARESAMASSSTT